jgi:2'-5' RNA ligase
VKPARKPADKAETESNVRLFFALWPEIKTRNALAAWQQKLLRACGGRAMRPWTLHLTLAFLGSTPEDSLDAVKTAAAGARGAAFEMMIDRAGFWPHNRIVWVGCETVPPALAELQADLVARLAAAGISFDAKPFHVHITLLRNARPPTKELPEEKVVWSAREYVLVESKPAPDLGPDSSRYEIIARFPLK